MDRHRLKQLLEGVQRGTLRVDEGLAQLETLPFVALEHTNVDTHRELRCGFPEVVLGESKLPSELVEIARSIVLHHGRLLVTRVDDERANALCTALPDATHHARARMVSLGMPDADDGKGGVLVVSAGTSDGPVADEAVLTARMMGARTEALVDVGVAGIHRLLAESDRLRGANVVIVVAGMEGALASVVGGLVDRPVIAVPTSVGYGASFGGIAPLLAMLNTCAAGVTVVNIDNGFGAGYSAARINSLSSGRVPAHS